MKKSIVFFLSCYALAACTDSVDFAQVKKEIVNYNVSGDGRIGHPGEYKWTRLPDQDLGEFDYYDYTFPFIVDGTAYCLGGYSVGMPFKLNNSTKKWESLESDFDFSGFYDRYLFSYGSKIYYNFKTAEDGYAKRNIGALDMNTGIEQEKAQFPVDFPAGYISFVIGNKGYLMGGRRSPGLPLNQMWEYNFDLDQWTNKGTMPGGARAGGVGFVMGKKVYFGLGYNIITMNGQNIERPRRDWMSFDPTSGTYAAVLPDFPGTLDRTRGFALNDKIYMRDGFCNVNDSGCDELWEYNIDSGKWSKKSVPERRTTNINFFSLGKVGYMVVGSFEEFWKYSINTLVPIP